MKPGRIVSIKDPRLQKIRNNLRRVIISETYARMKALRQEEENIRYDSEGQPRQRTYKENRRIRSLIGKKQKLRARLKKSICLCALCNQDKSDMVFHPKWKKWYCVKCYQYDIESRDPEKFFNKGVVVQEDAYKPCLKLNWCPYGALVEAFQIGGSSDKTVCYTFDHDCPVFYVSEDVIEDDRQAPPPPNPKLKDNLRNIPFFNDKHVINRTKFNKPCERLYYCPYGSLGDKYELRDTIRKFACKIYPHDCPMFYHADRIVDFEEFETEEDIYERNKIEIFSMIKAYKKLIFSDIEIVLDIEQEKMLLLIYELIGEGKVEGEFPDEDTFQINSDVDTFIKMLSAQFKDWNK